MRRRWGGDGEACLGALSYVGNFGNPVQTFSDFDVDVLSHPELREGGDGSVLLLGPVQEVLVAVGKGLRLDLTGQGEVPRLEVDLRVLRYLQEGRTGEGQRTEEIL